MSVAAPWPLKVVVDSVVGARKLPHVVEDAISLFAAGGDRIPLACRPASWSCRATMAGPSALLPFGITAPVPACRRGCATANLVD